jgi:hypothetical protein
MKLRRKRRDVLPVIVAPPDDPRCRAIAVSSGQRCRLDAQPSGYCEVFHKATPAGPKAA